MIFRFKVASTIVEFVNIEADNEKEARDSLDEGYQADETVNIKGPEVVGLQVLEDES